MFACSDCGFFSNQGAGCKFYKIKNYKNLNPYFSVYIYLYTKEQLPPLSLINDINEKLEQCGVPLDMIQRQDQISCGLLV